MERGSSSVGTGFIQQRCARRLLGALAALLIGVSLGAQDVGFEGPSFTGAGAGTTPTEAKPESKLWFNDGTWWGSLWSNAGSAFRIHRLNFATHQWVDTGVAIESRPNSHSDVLWNGTKLYVVSHQFSTTGAAGNPILFLQYGYDGTSDTYSLDAGFPVTIGSFSTEAAVVDEDSTGTVWAAWTQQQRVRIAHTTNAAHTTWSAAAVLPSNTTNINADDICSLVHFNGDRIGVAWSDQVVNAYRFSVHVDGAADTAWSAVENISSTESDDHLNLAADAAGRVYLAGKNAANNMLLFRRASAGGWSRFVVTNPTPVMTRPIVLLNETAQTIHVFMTGQDSGEVFEKTSPMGTVAFGAGSGTIRMRDASAVFRISNPTSSKQNFDASTGLVVLAHHDTTGNYWRHEVAPVGGGGGPVANFTATPTSGPAPLNVAFTDTSTGTITSRSWSFGDGSTSAATNPTHSYAAGTYTVSLTVTGPGGSDVETRTSFIVSGGGPPPGDQPVLSAPVPGTAGGTNTLTVSGVTPGSVVGFYTSQSLGSSVITRPSCPAGIPIGLRVRPTLLGTARASAAGVATRTFSVPASNAGRVLHFQAVDQAACRASNVVSEPF